MKYPCLIRESVCKTEVFLTLYGEGLTEDGAPEIILEHKLFYPGDDVFPSDRLFFSPLPCNMQNGAKTVFTDKQKRVEANGTLLFPGDICPDAEVIGDGFVLLDGVRRDIVRGVKARNPDGTVNYTRLDVV